MKRNIIENEKNSRSIIINYTVIKLNVLLYVIIIFLSGLSVGFSQNRISPAGLSYVNGEPDFYMGFGTTISSYLGGDFGSTFQIDFFRSYYDNDYYYDDYYYNNNNPSFIYPLQLDLLFGYKINNYLSAEFETSFLFHLDGWAARQYESGTIGEWDYLDRYDNATLYAVPFTASLKLCPFGSDRFFYLKGGFSTCFMSESVDRVREYYTYDYYYYYNRYNVIIGNYNTKRWLSGFIVGLGFRYSPSDFFGGETEIRYSGYFNSDKKDKSPLSIDRTSLIQNLALNLKFYIYF